MVDQEYRKALDRDTLEQFRGKPNLAILHDALARQLQDVYACFTQLNVQRDLYTAIGAQLNGIGEIAVLTRKEAGLLAGNPIPVIDDDMYRQYLIWKVLKNTTDCTYRDIIKAFRMFWERPLYYREDLEQPATMIFDTGEITPDTDIRPLLRTPLLRAAGVTMKLWITIVTGKDPPEIHVGGGVGAQLSIGVPLEPDVYDFQDALYTGGTISTEVTLPVPEDTVQPAATTILRSGGVFTIISKLSGED